MGRVHVLEIEISYQNGRFFKAKLRSSAFGLTHLCVHVRA